MAERTRDIAAERADIDRAVAGKTVPTVFQQLVEQYPDEPALKWRTADGWQTLTWAQYREQVRDAAMGLLRLGFGPGQFGVIMARNRPEHMIADLAIVHRAGRAVSIYNTLAPEQIAYIVGHCEARVAFLEDRGFLDKFLEIRDQVPGLRRVVLMEGQPPPDAAGWVVTWRELMEDGRRASQAGTLAFESTWKQLKPDDIISLIYTSGTTGAPKGVTYTHYNVLWTCESSRLMTQWEPGESIISYLPLAHVAERFTSHWGGIYNRLVTYLVPDTSQLAQALVDVRPNVFVGVPRVWEKFQVGIQLGIAAEQDPQRKSMIESAIAVGRQVFELQQLGEAPSPELAARAEAMAPILTAIRAKIGLDRCRLAVTSTAPIPTDVLLFFASIGLPLYEVWGMSELTGPATSNPLDGIRLGTVGVTLPGVEARLGEDGEILVRGGNVMPGYYKDPERTVETMDADGWLHSGDVATLDEQGYFRIVDRKKDLIINSYGKNMSPSNIEAQLTHHPLVGQAMAIGDGRPYVTALIVLDQEVAPAWARAHGIAAASVAELAENPAVVAEVQRGVAEANAHLSHPEQVRRFTILPAEWTAESEELTPTLKMRRRVVVRKYARDIDGMYASPPTGYAVEETVAVPVRAE